MNISNQLAADDITNAKVFIYRGQTYLIKFNYPSMRHAISSLKRSDIETSLLEANMHITNLLAIIESRANETK